MSLLTRPKVRVEGEEGDSSPIEAMLMTDGRIRLMTDPDALHYHSCWLTPAEIREFATDLLGLADASEAIYG
jgi:hypothetical protein